MKFQKRLAPLLLAVSLLCAAIPGVFAARDSSAEAGKTATVQFNFVDVSYITGTFSFSDTQGIVDSHTITVIKPGTIDAAVQGNNLVSKEKKNSEKTTVSVEVQIKLKENAPAAANCTVAFTGIYKDDEEHDIYEAAIVTVKKTEPTPVQNTDPANSTTSAESAQTAAPVKPEEPKVSYTELEKQIGIASGLKNNGYTDSSWNAMQQALVAAKAVRKDSPQKAVTEAAKSLAASMNALVKMDHTELQQAISKAGTLADSTELMSLWEQLLASMKKGEGLLTSGDQSAVDEAAAEIEGILTQIEQDLEEINTPKIVEVEVPVEIMPTDDYCNMAKHNMWPILLGVSVGVNLLLVVVMVVYTVRKKTYDNDDTPLVDYDIDDEDF